MKFFLTILTIVTLVQHSFAQIPDVTYAGPTDIANSLAGPGVTVFNATYSGDSRQIALFSDGLDKIGFPTGALLTTGDAKFAETFNTSNSGDADQINSTNSDPDLAQIMAGATPRDAIVVEFDFITNGSLVEFEYVFASDEYAEEVCSPFNDAFGFFISGPGISGTFTNMAKNVALIPGTNTPVSINTVNGGQIGGFGSPGGCGGPGDPGLNNTAYYIDNLFNNPVGNPLNEGNAQLAYDGHTVVMTASCPVICGEVYHIKLVIGNANDHFKDSGVFLKEGSMRSDFELGPLTASPIPVCEGDPLTLTVAGDPSYTYTWSTGQTGVGLTSITVPAVFGQDTYSVTATNVDGCELTSSVNVITHSASNNPPFVNGIGGTGEYNAYVQAGDQICFNIPSFDDPGESVSISWDGSISGASFTGNGAFQESGTFCWTPGNADIGWHSFEVTVTDGNVCGNASATYTFYVKVVCDFCPICIDYNNRTPGSNPLPAVTEAGQCITAGLSATVETGTASVEFIAPQITLGTHFTGGPGFSAIADNESCIESCDACCENWSGFTLDLPIANVFTPNGDGVNDFWYIADTDNPFCAFNATGFDLVIKTPSGSNIYVLSDQATSCCPYRAPSSTNPIPHSSIFWDGIANTGIFAGQPAPDGVYFYVLKLYSCGNEADFASFFHIVGSNGMMIQNQGTEIAQVESSKYYAGTTDAVSGTGEHILMGVDKQVMFSDQYTSIVIYPNPNNGLFTVELSDLDDEASVEIHSLTGQLIHQQEIINKQTELRLEDPAPGVYLVKVKIGSRVETQRIVIQ